MCVCACVSVGTLEIFKSPVACLSECLCLRAKEIRITLQLEQDVCSVTRCPCRIIPHFQTLRKQKKMSCDHTKAAPRGAGACLRGDLSGGIKTSPGSPKWWEAPHAFCCRWLHFWLIATGQKQSLTYGTPELVAGNSWLPWGKEWVNGHHTD